MSAPVEALPLVAPPVEKPPAAVQEDASEELQESVADWPVSMVEGVAESETVGTGGGGGGNELQEGGFVAPLVQGLNELQEGGLLAPFEHDGNELQVGGFVAPLVQGLNALQVGGFVAPFPQEEGAFTVTVADCCGEEPPGPVHWK